MHAAPDGDIAVQGTVEPAEAAQQGVIDCPRADPANVQQALRTSGDDHDRIWFSEANTKRLVGFDPKTEKFFANIEVSGPIRNMYFDRKTRTMWFGTDANNVGRITLQNAN